MTRPTWLKAIPIALVIVAIVFLLVVGPDFAFGIKTGWLGILMLSLFIAIEKQLSKKALLNCALGVLYGIAVGQAFPDLKPVFALAVVVLLVCIISGKLPQVMNNYALVTLTVYTIEGVAKPDRVWQDLICYIVGLVILFIITIVAEKKATAVSQNIKSGEEG